MRFYLIEPEVAGGLGVETIRDRRVHPPIISRLHYEFDGWLGDQLLTTFPCYIVTEAAMRTILAERLTGVTFDDVLVTTSYDFEERYPDERLPRFVWLKVMGRPEVDDFGLDPIAHLIVSDRALRVLTLLGVAHAIVKPYRD
jgi:hypothetical protein